MELYMYWFILAFILLGVEMMTGTFYMLVLAIAMAVGGLAALVVSLPVQLALCAMAAVAGWVVLFKAKGNQKGGPEKQSLDVGQTVKVVRWGEHGQARVQYRGAEWDAELEPSDASHEGVLYIKSMRGSTLILSHDKPV